MAADVIRITGVRAHGNHGVYAFERAQGQVFVVDAAISSSFDHLADDIDATVSYVDVAQHIVALIEGAPVDLIETLAVDIADDLLALPGAAGVQVTVHKPDAPIGLDFDDVSVTVSRGQW